MLDSSDDDAALLGEAFAMDEFFCFEEPDGSLSGFWEYFTDEDFETFTHEAHKNLNIPDKKYFVLWDAHNENVAGYCVLNRHPALRSAVNNSVELSYIFTIPEMRGQRLAALSSDACFQYLFEENFEGVIYANIKAYNDDSKRALGFVGFEQTQEDAEWYGRTLDGFAPDPHLNKIRAIIGSGSSPRRDHILLEPS